ncbi:SCO family protein [Rhodohalobacter mucosus]|uniref:SCO family protein n=1 Tax=Rhodohalobacter mucosus TaxID=2079485 RepID=A0A316TXH2_9BACT|nr:SCO family protein [Rhodohalobacter mucosus]PWN07995.1 SCO family protein [Rhodohalobacter mucosus]
MKTMIKIFTALLLLAMLPSLAYTQHHHGNHSNSNALDAMDIQTDYSVYHSTAVWTSHRNEEIRLSEFAGKPVIVVMVYGNCTQVCPILVRDAKRVFEGVDEELQSEVRVAVVTFDPENDTPERWMEYAEQYELNIPQWHFLTGSQAHIRELAMLLGVEYIRKSDGHFAHSNLVSILDEKGAIAERMIGLNQPVDAAVTSIESRLRKEMTTSNEFTNQHNHR